MSPLLLLSIASTVLPVIGYYIQRNRNAKKIDAAIQEWAPIVFDVVNNLVQQNPDMAGNKSAIFTRNFTEIMTAKGFKVTSEMLIQAKAIVDSIHYQDKRAQQQHALIEARQAETIFSPSITAE
jgi:hypothetical protein